MPLGFKGQHVRAPVLTAPGEGRLRLHRGLSARPWRPRHGQLEWRADHTPAVCLLQSRVLRLKEGKKSNAIKRQMRPLYPVGRPLSARARGH